MLLASLVTLLSFAPQSPADAAQAAQDAVWAADRDARMVWWREARFGMFVHWGLYSGAGGEWNGKVYEQPYAEWIQNWAAVPCAEYAAAMKPLFQPDANFADAWAELAEAAGMRYAVMTAKHHEGFTLFDSKQPYSVHNEVSGGTNISPAGRDCAREFADAMRQRGLRVGFYYSLLDWQHPDAYEMNLPGYPKIDHVRNHAAYLAYVRGHVDELLRNYGPLSTIWFDYSDAEHQGEAWGASQLLRDMRSLQPGILVNNRLYDGLENKHGDYGTPEKYVPPTGLPAMDWEVNHTLNESYGFSAHDVHWKDAKTVVQLLCDIVSKGGNLLLNIGPDAHGRVPAAAAATLRGVGAWMRTNHDAIQGTTASPFERLPWGRATQKPGRLYLMVFDWPADGVLRVPLANEATKAQLLGDERRIGIGRDARTQALLLTVPGTAPDPSCSVIELRIDGPPAPQPFVVLPAADGTITLTPHDATLVAPLRVERDGDTGEVQYNLGYWLDEKAFATWPVSVPAAQRYEVHAMVACKDAAAGSRYAIEIGEQAVTETMTATGGWQRYEDHDLGAVTLAPGTHTVALRARSLAGEAVLNLRQIRLVPVKR